MDGVGSQSQQAQEAWNKFQAVYGERAGAPREFKKALDQEDFLKIMITQMKNQDPTKPFESDKLAQEIAQISSIEQMSNINKTLASLSQTNAPLEKMGMANLIGKTVTVDVSRFEHTEGLNEYISFDLAESAANAKVELVHESGQVMATREMTSLNSGTNGFKWDGKKDNSLPSPGGVYYLRVAAQSHDGRDIQTNFKVRSQVQGVNYAGKEPVLVVRRNGQPANISMDTVVSIENTSVEDASKAKGQPAFNLPPGSQAIALPDSIQRKVRAAAEASPVSTAAQVAPSPERSGAPQFDNAALQEAIQQRLKQNMTQEIQGKGMQANSNSAAASLGATPEMKSAAQGKASDEKDKSARKATGFPNGLNGSQSPGSKAVSASSSGGGVKS